VLCVCRDSVGRRPMSAMADNPLRKRMLASLCLIAVSIGACASEVSFNLLRVTSAYACRLVVLPQDGIGLSQLVCAPLVPFLR